MKAQCLFLPADGQGAALALPPANTHQAGDMGVSNHCSWETKWPGYVSLIEEEAERLGLTVCFCTVIRSEEGVKVNVNSV
ncbi:hypothetical protein AV530_007644 [Patagioenas fasciata monilis]|uniref:Uncharacterized protein n=1 Tax=Patagioenas fasciata monilis TaxID=372326 RepID=A0A1V4JYR4_PATFA|nr:hypothetical protein AV530_007644 [Patagioenas fasciata monilis]